LIAKALMLRDVGWRGDRIQIYCMGSMLDLIDAAVNLDWICAWRRKNRYKGYLY